MRPTVTLSTDGIARYPLNGIRVIIVGGGVGGLAAALECWRKGCDVVVLEKSDHPSPLGDYFSITPSALATLKEYPGMWADYHESVYDCSIHVYTPSGVAIKSSKPEWTRPGASHAAPGAKISFLKRRTTFARMQLDQLYRIRVPVHFGSDVQSVDEDEDGVTVKTTTGTEYRGDICITATGIGGETGTDGEEEIQDSGYAIARVAFPRKTIQPGSPAYRLLDGVETNPQFRTYVAHDSHLILFLTKDWVAWAFTHLNDGDAVESWHNLRNADAIISEVEKTSSHWDPAVLDFIRQTPTQVVDWGLRWRDGNEQWTSDGGRVLRLGDAAHAYLPTSGNGAVQALEDAASVAECLSIGGKLNVPWATRVHNKLRFQRTSILQQAGFVNREELHSVDTDVLGKDPDAYEPGFFKTGRWTWAHDPEMYARDNYHACLANLRDGKPFSNTNLPPGHVYQPWSLESERQRVAAHIPSQLKSNGDWGR